MEARGIGGQGSRPGLARIARCRWFEGRADFYRLASEGSNRALGAGGEGAARCMEGLARLSCGIEGWWFPAEGLRRPELHVLRKGAERNSRATPAMAARSRLHEPGPWRSGRQALRRTLFSARSKGEGARHGRRSGESIRSPNRRPRLDVARHEDQSEGEVENAICGSRLSRQMDGLLLAGDRQGRRARQPAALRIVRVQKATGEAS